MSEYNFSLEANNINKTYNKKGIKINALNDFNINIKKGTIYGLLGPNGAGKSTFINILAGLVKKSSGSIKICNIDLDKDTKICRKKIGVVPQELNIDPFFSPIELLDYIGAVEDALGVKANKELLPLQSGDVPDTYANVDDLVREFNYRPSMDINQGVRNFVDWYKKYNNL